MTVTAVMGIDPGVRGGIAVLNNLGEPIYIEAVRPKMTRREVFEVARRGAFDLAAAGGLFCYLEKVGARPTDGRAGIATFLRCAGLLEGGAYAGGATVREVSPPRWQSALGCLSGGNKNVTKQKAIELFPRLERNRITHATADALLIAEFGRRRLRGGQDVWLPTL